MGNIKELSSRINGISAAKKVTTTMNMIAYTQFIKYKVPFNAADEIKLSIEKSLKEVCGLEKLDSGSDELIKNQNNNLTYLFIGGNRGFSGSFNAKMARLLKNTIKPEYNNPNAGCALVLGKKLLQIVKTYFPKELIKYIPTASGGENYFYLAKHILKELANLKAQSVCIFYTKFNNMLHTQAQVCKINLCFQNLQSEYKNINLDDTQDMLHLYEKYLLYQMYYFIISTKMSEAACRIVAMHAASKNCDDLITNLTLEMNKTRQANITNELTEIIAGSQAL